MPHIYNPSKNICLDSIFRSLALSDYSGVSGKLAIRYAIMSGIESGESNEKRGFQLGPFLEWSAYHLAGGRCALKLVVNGK